MKELTQKNNFTNLIIKKRKPSWSIRFRDHLNKYSVLQGIVMRLPSEEFNENIVDAVDITFSEINHLLSKHKLETLCMDIVNNKRRIVKDDIVVDIDNAENKQCEAQFRFCD